ncbi:MAG: MFS transporter [Chloroflexi bacterium]|nr:MFS transporter [Chloroflexota bacterium]
MPRLSRDGWLLFATGSVRHFAYGFLSVILGLYLASQGLEVNAIGGIFTAALAGGAVMTVVLTAVADSVGRRRVLMLGAVLMAVAGAVFSLTNDLTLLIVAAIVGTISPSGKEVGPFLSVEHAMLPQTTSDQRRTSVFAVYNTLSSFAGALGSLAVGLPGLLGLEEMSGYRILLWGYVAAAVVLLLVFSRLSRGIEAPAFVSRSRRDIFGLRSSHRTVAKLAGLIVIDGFSGGFIVQGLISYWLYLRFGADTSVLAATFFGTNLLSGLTFLAAPAIARRVGLVRAMVFTHLPSNIFLLVLPFMPNLELAMAVLLARSLLTLLDVPARQSYIMAIVRPDERSATAGITAVARSASTAIAPAFAGATLAVPALGLPFLIAGALKIIYDVAILVVFRDVRPPEECPGAEPAIERGHRRATE